MSWWLLQYDLVDDYLERRAALREEHLSLATAAHERGEPVLAGPLPIPPTARCWCSGPTTRPRPSASPKPTPTCDRDS